jgi:hypothetical protein
MVTGGGLQRGTWKGELTRSVFLFKSFPNICGYASLVRAWECLQPVGEQLMYQHLLPAPRYLVRFQAIERHGVWRNPREMIGRMLENSGWGRCLKVADLVVW